MDATKITATMIDTAVSRGIKELEDDPKRTIRKMADLGRQFSTGHFQPKLFEIFQQLLENEDSPYYDFLQYFLRHTDKDNLKKFGINIGYYSWTHYARILRTASDEKKRSIPWILDIHYSICQNNSSINAEDIRNLISDVNHLGINTFSIFLSGKGIVDNSLFSVFEAFPESAFFLFTEDAQLTISQQGLLKKAGNVILLVNCSGEDALATCSALNSSGNLYSIYFKYNDTDVKSLEQRSFYDALSAFPANMLYLLRENENVTCAGKLVKNIRMEAKAPYFIWECEYDKAAIGEFLLEKPAVFLTVLANGNIQISALDSKPRILPGVNIKNTGFENIIDSL